MIRLVPHPEFPAKTIFTRVNAFTLRRTSNATRAPANAGAMCIFDYRSAPSLFRRRGAGKQFECTGNRIATAFVKAGVAREDAASRTCSDWTARVLFHSSGRCPERNGCQFG